MSDVSVRIVDWLSSVLELLREPMTTMPTQTILDRLRVCYDSTAASWNWRDPDGAFGTISAPEDIVGARPARDVCPMGAVNSTGPAMGFTTGHIRRSLFNSPIPAVVISGDRRLIQLGMEHQLSIPYRLDGTMFRTFIVARGGKDYSDDDLMLARHIQQSLITVDQQISVLARASAEHGVAAPAADFQLTGRESAALQLLAEGLVNRDIADRLNISEHTIKFHIGSILGKLQASSRTEAVTRGLRSGLIEL